MAEIDDRLRSSFCRDYKVLSSWRFPDLRYSQQCGRERVLTNQNPIVVQVFGVGQPGFGKVIERPFHRVKWVTLICQDAEFDDLMKLLGRRRRIGVIHLVKIVFYE